jgi:quinol monooxygenase YgiN
MRIERREMLALFVGGAVVAAGGARAQMLPEPKGLPAGSVAPVGDNVISYIEVMPGSEKKAITILKDLKVASLKDAGAKSFSLFQRATTPNHFLVIEEWSDNAARETHLTQAHVTAARAKLAEIETAPYDERPHRPLATGPVKRAAPGALTCVTHVDFVPVYREEGETMLKMLADSSRVEPGAARFDVLTQGSRPNHMTLVETWNSEDAWRQHLGVAHTKNFRLSLLPRSGSVYDERKYKSIG